MTQQLYKVVLRYRARIVPVSWCGGWLMESPDLESNREDAARLIARATQWIEDADREADFVNAYDNTDHVVGHGEIVCVVNDRDTALMLKLALA